MRTLIANARRLVTMDDPGRELDDGYLLIDDKIISAISSQRPSGDFDQIIDASGCIVVPGFINTHHHLYQTMQRVVPFVQDAKLFDWLTGLYQIWRELSDRAAYVSAQVGLAELLLSGCTTVADHFYLFPQSQPSTILDETLRAARDLGVRFHPTRGSMSLGQSQGGLPPDDVVQTEAAILEDSLRVIETYHDANPLSMCRISLAPCSPFSVTEDLMIKSADLARKHQVRLHTHLAETLDEEQFCIDMVGLRPLAYMERVGWVGDDVWFAHGVHFNDAELELLAKTQTGVAHCPGSNLRLGSGIARVPEMIARGVPVGLAVDGSASNDGSNMLNEIRLACMVHRVGTGVDQMPARQALRLATRGSAQVLGRDDLGQLAPGQAADLAIFDLNDIAYAGALHDPTAALVMTHGPARARDVFVNGVQRVKDSQIQGLDSQALIDEHNSLATQMVEKMQQRTGLKPMQHTVR